MKRSLPAATGYDRFADYLLGTTDSTAKQRNGAAEICGVSAVKIRELAEIFHHNTTMLMAGWGMQRQQFGEPRWMIVTLAAMLGQNWYAAAGLVFLSFAGGGNPTPRRRVSLDAGKHPRRGRCGR